MSTVKEILFKRYYVRDIITLCIMVLALIIGSLYSSLAFFQKTYETPVVASIVASEIVMTISTPEDPSETPTKTITVEAGVTKFINVTVTNAASITAKYKLWATPSSADVSLGIASESENGETGLIDAHKSLEVRIGITNNSTSTQTVILGVESGYAHNEIEISDVDSEIDDIIIDNGLLYPIFNDTSGANEPILAEGMIPVVYDEKNDVWVKADEDRGYYAYQYQIWANAVTVTNENRSEYMNSEPGTPILMEDINSMWVWIPRYKYKISNNIGSSSVVTNPKEIDVIFENGSDTTGVTEKVYRSGITSDGTNTNYYTHPAFRDINNIEYDSSTLSRGAWDEEITGFWVAKFETGNTASYPQIKPDIKALTNQNISAQFATSLKLAGGDIDTSTGIITFNADESNMYGLNTINNTTNTHMMKNTEWGAVSILSQSQYGKMGSTGYEQNNKEIYINNSSELYTGRSAGAPYIDATKYGVYSYNNKTCGTNTSNCTGDKVKFAGAGASTTGTIYGIYDMSGGSLEYTMGNWNNVTGSSEMSFLITKYYDLYNGSNSSTDFDKIILGDATFETKNWYSDYNNIINENNPWFGRSNYSTALEEAGIFFANYNNGLGSDSISFRITLMP